MNLTQTTALKWTFYALAAAALFFLRRLLLGSMTFFGVIPFLPPVILAVMASFELPRSSVIAGIVFGALCDLVLYDVKAMDGAAYRSLCGRDMRETERFLSALRAVGTPTVVRQVALDGWDVGRFPDSLPDGAGGCIRGTICPREEEFPLAGIDAFYEGEDFLCNGDAAVLSVDGLDAADHIALVEMDVLRFHPDELARTHAGVAGDEGEACSFVVKILPEFPHFVRREGLVDGACGDARRLQHARAVLRRDVEHGGVFVQQVR